MAKKKRKRAALPRHGGGGRKALAPLEKWMNGEIHVVTYEDYYLNINSFRSAMYNYATKHGCRVQMTQKDDDSCYLQFYDA